MALIITGRLHKVNPTEIIKENFSKRDFIVELVDETPSGMVFTNYAVFQLVNNACSYIDNYRPGDMITVYFTIRGNKWERDGEIKYITNLSAWRLESGAGQAAPPPAPQQTVPQQQYSGYTNTGTPGSGGFGNNGQPDDLPF